MGREAWISPPKNANCWADNVITHSKARWGHGMHWLEMLGYMASGAVFVTFWMKTMIPLRVIGISSNLLFFAYGLYGGLIPIAVLHGNQAAPPRRVDR